MSDRLRRRPVLWVVLASVAALGVGVGLGMAGQQPALDEERAKSRELRADVAAAQADRDEARRDLGVANRRIAKLTARGEVPNFAGGSVDDAELAAGEYDWVIKTRTQPSDRPRGEIIAQVPREGVMLRRGRTVTLVVAAPRPKEWRTIKSFSGSGAQRTNEFTIPAGRVRMRYSFVGDTNAIVELKTPGGGTFDGDLLLNEIGSRSGTTRLYDSEGVHYLDIQGGSWTVELQAFR